MQYQAYLSRSSLEQGAALIIMGNRLATQDTVTIELSDKQSVTATVSAFGLGRLVVSTGTSQVELLPWISGQDAQPETPPGATSKWTVKAVRG